MPKIFGPKKVFLSNEHASATPTSLEGENGCAFAQGLRRIDDVFASIRVPPFLSSLSLYPSS